MKKIIAVLLCCVLLSVNAYAADELPDVENEEIEYLEDGSCFVTITEIVSDGLDNPAIFNFYGPFG